MNTELTYNQIKERKQSKYVAPSGSLSNNPTGYLIQYLIQFVIKAYNKDI